MEEYKPATGNGNRHRQPATGKRHAATGNHNGLLWFLFGVAFEFYALFATSLWLVLGSLMGLV
jgi:hypothetical protein